MTVQLALTATLFVFCLAVIYGAICDVTTYTIPNRVSYGLAAFFAVFAALSWGQTPVLLHIGLAVMVFIICMVFWKLRWLGGGDVKFVAAISLWMGPGQILPFVVLLALLSAAFVMVLQFVQRWNPYFQGGRFPAFFKQMMRKAEEGACPYGLPAAIAALIVVPEIIKGVY